MGKLPTSRLFVIKSLTVHSRTVVSRGRDRFLVKAAEGLSKSVNGLVRVANHDLAQEDQLTECNEAEFDLDAIDQNSDIDSEPYQDVDGE